MVFVVATPIGNKSDLSFRAVETLKNVDIIACEDSRVSAKLLESYNINTKMISYHKFNEKQRTSEFLKLIEEGKKIALVSDAGTPCISDPGRILVQELWNHNIKVTSIPGASAVTTFLSMIPRNSEEFAFAGFLPRVKPQQKKVFDKFKDIDTAFYESANRLIETLENIKEFRGENAKVAVGRELTKLYEEVKTGSVGEVIDYFNENILKGEIVFVLYADKKTDADESEILEKIKKLKAQNYSDKDISIILSSLFDLNKNKVYKLSLDHDKIL
jgi:16S rRNA (cytidine1402-2'-O)-methyltransferase